MGSARRVVVERTLDCKLLCLSHAASAAAAVALLRVEVGVLVLVVVEI